MDKMRELVDVLNKYAYQYYVLDNPTVSDKEYDALYDQLIRLERETGVVLSDSPSKRVGGEPLSSFSKHRHIERLYSLDKATSEEELYAFDKRINKTGEDLTYTVEYKFDGLTICLTYKDCEFVCATTRGNGIEGEDVTSQILTVKSFPLKINCPGTVEVQGEAVIKLSSLEEYNKTATEKLKNARNAVAGAVRNLDPKETAKRKVEIMFYNVNYTDRVNLSSQTECVEFLKQNGFKVHPFLRVCKGIDSVLSAIKDIENSRKSLDILTDGAVVKVNDFSLRQNLGFTDKFPRWAIAFKFEAEEVTTILEDVIWQVGRTGKLTPLGIVSPVELAGATVKKATLNNYGDLTRKGVLIGARVLIRRSNEVIPEILTTTEVYDNCVPVDKPVVCPYCGTELVETGANLFCPNTLCRPRIVANLSNFACKNGMNIDGFSSKTAEILFDKLGVKSFVDLYTLDYERIKEFDGFGELKTSNLYDSIEKSKIVEYQNFIFALGIDNVGKKTAKVLSEKFNTLEKLKNATVEDLSSVEDIGEVIALCIKEYFENAENLAVIDKLLDLGVTIIYPEKRAENGVFSGEKVVLTGTLTKYKRDEASKIIEDNGGKVMSSVSSQTTMVLAGENAGSKLDKARNLGIRIISEEEFEKILGK